MKKGEQEFEWHELKDIWLNSSQTRDIHIRMTELLDEVKNKTNQFEKDSIKSDLATLKASWPGFDRKVSQFEKDSIKKDLAIITRLVKKFLNFFKKNS
ncbi:hypothetical protein MATR_12830 [Marivirga tractuosa]|uniref:Uncharacterized protein n=1 Tax=Marivirga tractuosa (strain ATCC 23168 / DSM 4126 / NBRC 15989 / NCIMB 1408 / VKM B-1430 / H-43) TaxID=643867 RepID=E4TUY2_MARTH|nr:hypothetical protein [Marivirga tractuosa]ADR21087.1 hypothetical protein Ftrac_1092 [Marivirga tractuosa DSM 4126]BDD14458.1 hypothetical protein MATR_12830 [Marivirga tractuosa]